MTPILVAPRALAWFHWVRQTGPGWLQVTSFQYGFSVSSLMPLSFRLFFWVSLPWTWEYLFMDALHDPAMSACQVWGYLLTLPLGLEHGIAPLGPLPWPTLQLLDGNIVRSENSSCELKKESWASGHIFAGEHRSWDPGSPISPRQLAEEQGLKPMNCAFNSRFSNYQSSPLWRDSILFEKFNFLNK